MKHARRIRLRIAVMIIKETIVGESVNECEDVNEHHLTTIDVYN